MKNNNFNKNTNKFYKNNKSVGHPSKLDHKNEEIFITGKNVVYEAIKSGIEIIDIYICSGYEDNFDTIVYDLGQKAKVLSEDDFDKLNFKLNTFKNQKIIAKIKQYDYYSLDDIIECATYKNKKPFIILLDEITDPMNFGAIIRTANLAGVDGIIIKEKNNCEINNIVANASSGAVFHTKVAKVTNLSKTIDTLKQIGMWFACADMDGQNLYKANLELPLGIVIGNEGCGVSRLVKEKCDFCISIPMFGNIDSLNASVSAGIIMYEIVRRNNFSS